MCPGEREFTSPPDYCNDLNAMHEAWMEVIAKGDLTKSFFQYLYSVINEEPVKEIGYELDDLITCAEVAAMCVNATARQRAEAYLKTINKYAS